jgi:hypothetical protein
MRWWCLLLYHAGKSSRFLAIYPTHWRRVMYGKWFGADDVLGRLRIARTTCYVK